MKRRKIMLNLLKKFVKEEEGATMVEYAILVGLISVVAIALIGTVGQSVLRVFTAVDSEMDAVQP
jgi:pilus assembly protein Flp/PilA